MSGLGLTTGQIIGMVLGSVIGLIAIGLFIFLTYGCCDSPDNSTVNKDHLQDDKPPQQPAAENPLCNSHYGKNQAPYSAANYHYNPNGNNDNYQGGNATYPPAQPAAPPSSSATYYAYTPNPASAGYTSKGSSPAAGITAPPPPGGVADNTATAGGEGSLKEA